VVQAGMHSAGVYQLGKGHLVDTAEALVPGMGYHLKDKGMIEGDEAVNWVVYDLSGAGCHFAACCFVKIIAKWSGQKYILTDCTGNNVF
jgi:hypothetical protein